MEYFINRRLVMLSRNQGERRQKTADTKILNSRKLPHNFFSNEKRPLTPFATLMDEQYSNILPEIRK
jgi:hypothetical protein